MATSVAIEMNGVSAPASAASSAPAVSAPTHSADEAAPPSSTDGLRTEEVEKLRAEHGFNEVVSKEKPLILKFLMHFWGLSAWLLEACAIASFALRKWTDGAIPLILLIFNACLGFNEDRKANEALKALQSQLQIQVRVRRDGQWVSVPAREVVPGDVLKLRDGDVIAADAVHLEGTTLSVDQSALTGESMAVEVKKDGELFAGAVIRRGEALARVRSTGKNTKFGKTAGLLNESKPKLHSEELLRRIVYANISVVSTLVVISIIILAVRHRNIVNQIPLFITLLITAVPVALPAMLTISLALGSHTLVQRKVLVTRLSATEDAARMTMLCSDKTGTITTNHLAVTSSVPEPRVCTEAQVLLWAALASKEENQDPIDVAVLDACRARSVVTTAYKVVDFVPFNAETRCTEALVEEIASKKRFRVKKGAVKTLIEQCDISAEDKERWEKLVNESSTRGDRTLAVVYFDERHQKGEGVVAGNGDVGNGAVEPIQSPPPGDHRHGSFAGLLAMSDPPRGDSEKVIALLQNLGVRVIMITGDAIAIGKSIGAQVGLDPQHMVSLSAWRGRFHEKNTGGKVHESPRTAPTREHHEPDPKQSVLELPDLDAVSGLAEVFPEDKHAIVKTLQKTGFIVGMTGDGVNDAPALKQAEVGVAVSNATDVAKRSASAIMMKDGLSGILDLIMVGRKIHGRLTTWVLNYIIKTWQQSVFVMVIFWLRGEFPLASIHLLLLIIMLDFLTLALSTDQARFPQQPSRWRLIRLVTIGAVNGFVNLLELIGGYYYAVKISDSGYHANLHLLQSFCFLMMLSFTLLSILLLRERDFSFRSLPSWQLATAIVCDYVVATILVSVNATFISLYRIPGWDQGLILLYAFVTRFILNDPMKVLLFRLLLPDAI